MVHVKLSLDVLLNLTTSALTFQDEWNSSTTYLIILMRIRSVTRAITAKEIVIINVLDVSSLFVLRISVTQMKPMLDLGIIAYFSINSQQEFEVVHSINLDRSNRHFLKPNQKVV